MENKRTVVICGGGNGAHCVAGLAASRDNTDVKVLTLYNNEAEKWSKTMQSTGFLVEINNQNGENDVVEPKPFTVTNDPETALSSADIVFISLPAFAHEQYLVAIAKHLHGKDTIIVGLPGQTGFEFQCKHILKEKADYNTILSFETLPWACRIAEFGHRIQILGTKKELWISIMEGKFSNQSSMVVEKIQYILGWKTVLKKTSNCLAGNLMSKTMAHPAIMYGKWKNWNGKPIDEAPLFYQGIDEVQADYMLNASKEVVATAQKIHQHKSEVDMSSVTDIFQSILEYYDDTITDKSNLMMAMRTNSAYKGLVHPMKSIGTNQLVPDFNSRYLSEDIPFGLVVLKGIAEIVGQETPVIDEILLWCQEKLGKTYLVGSELKGSDVKYTRSPQSYDIQTLDDLLKF